MVQQPENESLWRFQEALRQAEKCVTAQQTQLAWVQGRATTTLGWISAELLGALALVGANMSKGLHNSETLYWLVFGVSVLIPASISTLYLIKVLPLMEWNFEGLKPEGILFTKGIETQEEMLHSMVLGLENARQENDATIRKMVRSLRIGWIWFLVIPPIAILSALLLAVVTLYR